MIIMVAGIARFKRSTGILVSGFRWHGMLRVTFNAFREIFLMGIGMMNPNVRINKNRIRLSMNVLFNRGLLAELLRKKPI